MTRLGFALLLLVTMVMFVTSSEPCEFCYPGDDTCWPNDAEGIAFAAGLKGEVIVATDARYANYTYMINTRVTKYPYVIIMAETINDVINAVKFANKFNVRLSIRSSGHDYIGRSTGDGTVQINLSKMQDLKFNLNSSRHAAGEVKAQSGNQWIRVYEEVCTFPAIVF